MAIFKTLSNLLCPHSQKNDQGSGKSDNRHVHHSAFTVATKDVKKMVSDSAFIAGNCAVSAGMIAYAGPFTA